MAPIKHSTIQKSARTKSNKKLKAALAASKRWGQVEKTYRPTTSCDDSNPVPSTSKTSENKSDLIRSTKSLGLHTIRVNDINTAFTRRNSEVSCEDNTSLHGSTHNTPEYAVVDIRCLKPLVTSLACPLCFQQNLVLKTSDQRVIFILIPIPHIAQFPGLL
ncbi:hypothetical protein J6590_061892 [Homalodisca vitripennis]|nr:hypothetical protein J6590_061892 [Homalodisca vitripennis]